MAAQKYLMSFEQIIQYLQSQEVRIEYRDVSALQSPRCFILSEGPSIVLSNDLFEKFAGTWWSVERSGTNVLSRFTYLADSLQDALRLQPDIDTFYWCNATDQEGTFVSEVIGWQEDEDLGEDLEASGNYSFSNPDLIES